MKIKSRQTGNLHWSKSPTTGHWSCTFRIDTPDGPRDRTVSTKETDKREAVKMAREAKLQWLNSGKFQRKVFAALQGCRKITIASAIIEWADSRRRFGALSAGSIRTYVSVLNAFARQFNLTKEQPVFITIEHVYGFVNQGGKMNTRNTRLAALKTWFGWMVCEHYVVTNFPESMKRIDMSKMSHKEKEVEHCNPFTDDELSQLMSYINAAIDREQEARTIQLQTGENYGYSLTERIEWLKFWNVAVRISRLTGLRIGDVCQLEHRALSDLAVHTDKSNARVELETNVHLRAAVLLIENNDPQYCFPRQRIRYLGSPSAVSSKFRKLCESAGIYGHSFHDLRAVKARALQAEGKTVPEIAERLGHSHTKTTEIYLEQ